MVRTPQRCTGNEGRGCTLDPASGTPRACRTVSWKLSGGSSGDMRTSDCGHVACFASQPAFRLLRGTLLRVSFHFRKLPPHELSPCDSGVAVPAIVPTDVSGTRYRQSRACEHQDFCWDTAGRESLLFQPRARAGEDAHVEPPPGIVGQACQDCAHEEKSRPRRCPEESRRCRSGAWVLPSDLSVLQDNTFPSLLKLVCVGSLLFASILFGTGAQG